jgi:hypothetical protein
MKREKKAPEGYYFGIEVPLLCSRLPFASCFFLLMPAMRPSLRCLAFKTHSNANSDEEFVEAQAVEKRQDTTVE